MPTLTNARVFDGHELLSGLHDVRVEGRRIESVLPHDPTLSGDDAIDLAGMTLMPGLITCHLHPDFYKFTSSGQPATRSARSCRRAC